MRVPLAAPVLAQQQNPAASHEELLRQQQVRADENKVFQDRRGEYEGKANQAEKRRTAPRRAEQQRTQLDAASKRLNDTHAANEPRINNLNTELRDKAGALGLAEVFGLARQAANDNSSILQQSLITTQFPPAPGEPARDEWLRQFQSARDADVHGARAACGSRSSAR